MDKEKEGSYKLANCRRHLWMTSKGILQKELKGTDFYCDLPHSHLYASVNFNSVESINPKYLTTHIMYSQIM